MMIAVQAAIYTRLSTYPSLAGVPIYDSVPQPIDGGASEEFPYITIGEDSAAVWDTDTSIGEEIEAEIHIWTRPNEGRRDSKLLQDKIKEALHLYNLPVIGAHTVFCLFLNAISMMDADGVTHHIVSRYRIIVEEIMT